jgi:release factor glutamine methyltransferase
VFFLEKVSSEVYSPAEDSWLLEECVLKENLKGKKCLDLGTGSGIGSIALFRAGAKSVLAVDINPRALVEAEKNVQAFLSAQPKSIKAQNAGHSKKSFEVKKSDLFSNVKAKFDFIIFNPPYVPTEEIKWVDLDGGKNGREVIDRFLPEIKKHLNKKGALLLLLSSLNNPKAIIKVLKRQGFDVKVAGKKKLFFEELQVLKCTLN